ncbi:glycosyltransferase family 4 protein [Verrucomicrobiota bacterium]
METRKNILFIHHGKFAGGAGKSLRDLIVGFARKDVFECHLIAPQGFLTDSLKDCCSVKALELVRFKKTTNPGRLIRHAMRYAVDSGRILSYCRQNDISLIYANSVHAFLYSLLATALTRARLVLHLRDRIKSPVLAWLVRLFCRKVISVSSYIDSQIRNKLKPRQPCIVYNGIDPNQFEIQDRPCTKTIGYAGQIIPWKRIELLVQAMEYVVTNEPEAKLLIAGTDLYDDHPFYHKQLEQMIGDMGLEKNVCFRGWRGNMNDFLSETRVLVLPSEGEPFGRILIEAMAANVPVVGVDSGAIPEIIEHEKTGLLCESNAKSISDAVLRLFQDSNLRAALVRNGRTRVEQRFNITDTVESIHSIVEQVAS